MVGRDQKFDVPACQSQSSKGRKRTDERGVRARGAILRGQGTRQDECGTVTNCFPLLNSTTKKKAKITQGCRGGVGAVPVTENRTAPAGGEGGDRFRPIWSEQFGPMVSDTWAHPTLAKFNSGQPLLKLRPNPK